MFSSSKIYLYHQRHKVVLLDTANTEIFSQRYYQVYTKNLIAHKGTDNQILFEFVNQDQKRVDITGYEFTCRLISSDGTELLLEKPLEIVSAIAGQAKLVLTETELDPIMQSKIGFSIEYQSGALNEPVFVDDHAGGRGIIDVVDSIMPSFIESEILSIPDQSNISSILATDDKSLYTFQIDMDQFEGDITVEGASDVDGLWYEIQTENITLPIDLYYFNVYGYHPYIRLNINKISGEIKKVQYR